MSANQLKQLLAGLRNADAEIRAANTCPDCGKPTAGLTSPGVTRAQAGLCTCIPAEFTDADLAQPGPGLGDGEGAWREGLARQRRERELE